MLLNILKKTVSNQRVLLLGFGREGRALYRRITQVGGYTVLGIADQNPISDAPGGAVLHIGADYQKAMYNYDIVFKSPGIVLETSPEQLPCTVTSLTEVFLTAYREQCIGITGTKGKSTTSSLLYHVLQTAGLPTVLGGNIGIPMADLYEQITPETVIVLEISVHQLEYTKVSPKIAVFLNLFEEHLDHYGTFAYYAYCKENIYRYQQAGDLLLCGEISLPKAGDCLADVLHIAIDDPLADISLHGGAIARCGEDSMELPDTMSLTGLHNRLNCAVVYALAHKLGVADEKIAEGIATFQPLPHRLEMLGEWDGIRWVNDSISTACETCIQALNSLHDTDTVMIGGMDRGISYTPLLDYLSTSDVPHIILMSDSGRRITEEAKSYDSTLTDRIITVKNLTEAVRLAKQITQKGKIALLSPAAASYNEYKNFEVRGEHFRSLVFANNAN